MINKHKQKKIFVEMSACKYMFKNVAHVSVDLIHVLLEGNLRIQT